MPARRRKKEKVQIVEKDIDLAMPELYHQRKLSSLHVKEILSIAYDPASCRMEITLRDGDRLRWSLVPQSLRDRFVNALGYESFADAEYWQKIHSICWSAPVKDHSQKWASFSAGLKGKNGKA